MIIQHVHNSVTEDRFLHVYQVNRRAPARRQLRPSGLLQGRRQFLWLFHGFLRRDVGDVGNRGIFVQLYYDFGGYQLGQEQGRVNVICALPPEGY